MNDKGLFDHTVFLKNTDTVDRSKLDIIQTQMMVSFS